MKMNENMSFKMGVKFARYISLDIFGRDSPLIWVCFTSKGVIQNGSIFRYPTHTSGHFHTGIAWGKYAMKSNIHIFTIIF